MAGLPRLSLRVKLTLIVVLAAGGAVLLILSRLLAFDAESSRRGLADTMTSVARIVGRNAEGVLAFEDPKGATEILSTLASEPQVVFAALYRRDGSVMATYRREGVGEISPPVPRLEAVAVYEGRSLLIFQPVQRDGSRLGSIHLRAETARLEARRRELLALTTRTLLLSLGGVLVLATLLIHGVVKDLRRSVAVAERVAEGDFTTRLEVRSNDEVGLVLSSLNVMTDHLATLIGQVQLSCRRIAGSTARIAGSAHELQLAAETQATATQQAGSASEEISTTARALVATLSQALTVSRATVGAADQGHRSLQGMEGVLGRLERAASTVADGLAIIEEKTARIDRIVATITAVADQTNLLSLNAAIEAERAGEHGAGFVVVASEIRRLADQTGVATVDIEEMVHEIRDAVVEGVAAMGAFSNDVEEGVREVREVGTQFSQIIAGIQDLSPRFETVDQGVKAQAEGADRINRDLEDLTTAADQTARAIRETTQALDDLETATSSLQQSIGRFHVGGERQRPSDWWRLRRGRG